MCRPHPRSTFNKDVSELTLSEASVIAGITQNPSGYNPITHPDKNAKRREKVLNNMKDQAISPRRNMMRPWPMMSTQELLSTTPQAQAL